MKKNIKTFFPLTDEEMERMLVVKSAADSQVNKSGTVEKNQVVSKAEILEDSQVSKAEGILIMPARRITPKILELVDDMYQHGGLQARQDAEIILELNPGKKCEDVLKKFLDGFATIPQVSRVIKWEYQLQERYFKELNNKIKEYNKNPKCPFTINIQ